MTMKRDRDPRVMCYLQYYAARVNGNPVDRLASAHGFDSPADLYEYLARSGFPICEVCGETPAGPEHCKQPSLKKRRARSGSDGKVVKLPPARNAMRLFEEVIGCGDKNPFSAGLHGSCERLRDLEEELHGKRFVSNMVFRPEDGVGFEGTLRRGEHSEDEWRRICLSLSQDHKTTDEITPYDVPGGPGMSPLGAGRTPAGHLVRLIATYALVRDDLDPLVAELHPEPEAVDWEKVRSAQEALRLNAEHLATLVRGGYVGKGAPVERLTREEANLAYVISNLKDEGDLSYREIQRRLKDYGHDLPLGEIERLGGLYLPHPDY